MDEPRARRAQFRLHQAAAGSPLVDISRAVAACVPLQHVNAKGRVESSAASAASSSMTESHFTSSAASASAAAADSCAPAVVEEAGPEACATSSSSGLTLTNRAHAVKQGVTSRLAGSWDWWFTQLDLGYQMGYFIVARHEPL